MDTSKLPSWAKLNEQNGEIVVDPDMVYPLFLDAIGFKDITQGTLETARLCFTEALFQITEIRPLVVRILKRPRWSLKNYPEGQTADWKRAFMDLLDRQAIPE